MERVVVARPVLGICHMQVCAVKDATDHEILEVVNKNRSGTIQGWVTVVREGEDKPVQCNDYPDRFHFMVGC